MPSLPERDRAHVWHPYTQHGLEDDPLPIVAAHGARLVLEDGRELVDGISSWWATLHGHGRGELVRAMAEQAARLDHVLFAGATHPPAVALAERLVALAPAGLTRVFFSDDGSTAVEVALKMVLQGWIQRGEAERRVFVALEGGYHGDTFGAMAVGDPDPFFVAFAPLLFEVRRAPVDALAVRTALAELGTRAAGVIVEPMVQGAAGMRVHGADFLRGVRAACDEHGVPLVADEVLTGFGRTGRLLACEHADVAPDLLCLAKGLTGGTFPLAATLAREELFDAFRSQDRARALFHGHTFTAHPVGCAVALASLDLVEREGTPRVLERVGLGLRARLAELEGHARVRELRQIGGIVALDLVPEPGQPTGYLTTRAGPLRRLAIERGVLLRPLGNVLYAMPPACIDEGDLDRLAAAMLALVGAAG